MMIYYKVLGTGHRACHGGTYRYTRMRWTRREKPVPCESGFHVATEAQLARWLRPSGDVLPLEVWEVETDGEVVAGDDKHTAERIRLTRLVGTLDAVDLRWLATEFAILALPHTDDPRVGDAIQTAREWCFGLADDGDLSVAGAAAGAAANAAEAAEVWAAAWAAAEAAWAAAEVVTNAAWAARAATGAAAWAADAAWAATDAEAATGRIVLDYLEAGVTRR